MGVCIWGEIKRREENNFWQPSSFSDRHVLRLSSACLLELEPGEKAKRKVRRKRSDESTGDESKEI